MTTARIVLSVSVLVGGALTLLACAQILGADAPTLAESQPLVGDAGRADALLVPKAEPDAAATCLPGTKFCDNRCVDVNDSLYGCDPVACAPPCSIARGKPKCESGRCAIFECDPNFGDCNNLAADGCESDLLSPLHCVDCKAQSKCGPGQVCRPAPFQCSNSCDVGASETECSGSCVNVENNPLHCGTCGTKCNDTTNGVGVCSGKKCGVKCNQGYVECSPGVCTAIKTFYRDADGDGFGVATQTVQGCTAPAGFSTKAGDCNDGNKDVFPGQTTFFPTAYPTGATVSFDYNCDAVETLEKPIGRFVGCDNNCNGSGYTPSGQSGKDVEPYCGSTTIASCIKGAGAAVQLQVAPTEPIPDECGTTISAAPAVKCR